MNGTTGWSRRRLFKGLAVATTAVGAGAAAGPIVEGGGRAHRAVYQVDDASRAINAFRNLENHHAVVPTAKLVVVALGDGIDFLVAGAKDSRGNPYEPMIDDRILAGVEFRVCDHTLVARGIERRRLHPDAKVVSSGAAEIVRLQCEEGFAYYRP